MSPQFILLPLFIQVALTFVLLGLTGYARVAAIRRGETRFKDIALREPNWPAQATKFGNSYDNQFQLPALFYVAVVLALTLGKADVLFVALSWAFVAARLCHALIHVTSNNVRRRFNAFGAGFIVLAAIWILLALRILILQ